MQHAKERVEQSVIWVIAALSAVISILDFFGLLDSIPWFAKKTPSLTLLILAIIAGYLVLERRNKLDKLENLVTTSAENIVSSLGGIYIHSFKYDLFVSSPMTSVTEELYQKARNEILMTISKIKEAHGFKSVYYAGKNIEKLDLADPASISVEQDLNALRSSRRFMLVYPGSLVTSSLVEAGYAIALGIPSVYFVHNRDDLPYMLRDAPQSYPDVRIYTYKDQSDLLRLIDYAFEIRTPR